MEYIISLILVMLLCIFISLSGCNKSSRSTASNVKPPVHATIAQDSTLVTSSLNRVEITTRLKKLQNSPPPAVREMGAMCYKVAAPPDRADYICPVCGERTLYASSSNRDRWNQVYYEIPACRQYVKEIKELDIEIDESQFCKKCSPHASSPVLTLIIKYPGEKAPHRVNGVTGEDLELIQEFLSGSRIHNLDRGRQAPLKDYTTRIAELLGVGR